MPSADRLDELRVALAHAEAATRDAYRDTTRLIRLLTVIGTPSPPEELIARTLTVLSEVYSADITCVANVSEKALHVTNSYGLPEDDPVVRQDWPVGPAAKEALRTMGPVMRSTLEPDDMPPSLGGIGIRMAAWVPLSPVANSETSPDSEMSRPATSPDSGTSPESDRELLILYRRTEEPFTAADLQVLTSVGYRMHTAVEARERGDAIEWLARTGPELARHLDLGSLLNEAVALLQRLTGAESAWVVTFNDDLADLRAQVGLSASYVDQWPRPVTDLPEWTALRSGESYTGRLADPTTPGSIELTVPVIRDGVTIAVLCLGGPRSRCFSKTALEITTILANYLAVAMTNSELYRALAQRETELRRRATHDPLTGLANRVLAAQRIEDALSRSPSPGIGLMFCDLDKFKEVNDRMGHEAGDELIQQVATRLKGCVGSTDLLARFGGDEFVVVIEGVDQLKEITDVGQRVRAAMTEPFILRGERVHISASVGGVLGVRGQDSATAMLRDADAAMYAAKVKGPGRVEVFDKAASHRSMDRLDLRSEMSRALENGQLTVLYQPIVRLKTNRITAFEALLRWNHPSRGPIPPDVFIPIAEETGAIVTIGSWVLEQACQQLARWRAAQPGRVLSVAVNMSAVQLAQPDLKEVALGALARAGLKPGDLWLEVTEHEHISEDVSEPVEQLRAAGVHFALDDFGMSYSNLSYLQRFPVEGIKVDRSFVSGVADREADRGIVRAIVAIADALDLAAVAEGVETPEQRDALIELGCPWGQGYLLAHPLSEAASMELLSTTWPPD